MKIGNIVSENKINVSDDFNVVGRLEDINPKLPTLIIGMDYISKHYPQYDITERKLSDNLYWTFKKTERRDLQTEDIDKFRYQAYINLISDINYVFVDPIQYGRKNLTKIIRKISSLEHIYCYQHNDMVYIYGEKWIFGIDLKLLSFVGLDSVKIKTKIKTKSVAFLEGDEIFIEYKNNVERLDNKVRYIPFLYSINHE